MGDGAGTWLHRAGATMPVREGLPPLARLLAWRSSEGSFGDRRRSFVVEVHTPPAAPMQPGVVMVVSKRVALRDLVRVVLGHGCMDEMS